MSIFSRKSKCPKCSTLLDAAGSPCPKCEWGHIVLSLDPDKAVNAPNIMGNIYVSDSLIQKIHSKQTQIKEIEEHIQKLSSNPDERHLTLAWDHNKPTSYSSQQSGRSFMFVEPKLQAIIMAHLVEQRDSRLKELEQLRTGDFECT